MALRTSHNRVAAARHQRDAHGYWSLDVFGNVAMKRRYRFSLRSMRWRRPTYVFERFPEGNVLRVWAGWVFVKVLIDSKRGEPRRRLTDRQAEWELMHGMSRESLSLAREIGNETRTIIGAGHVRRVPFSAPEERTDPR